MKPQQPLTVGVILARKGSKGIPNKNLVELYGKPIIQYTIDFAKETQTVDTLILSTDSRSIADLGIRSGIQTLIRPSEYATDEAPIDLALRHAVRNFESSNQTIDIIVVLYGNVPIGKIAVQSCHRLVFPQVRIEASPFATDPQVKVEQSSSYQPTWQPPKK